MSLPSFDSFEALHFAVWLFWGGFFVRFGWSTGGWVRRKMLRDTPRLKPTYFPVVPRKDHTVR